MKRRDLIVAAVVALANVAGGADMLRADEARAADPMREEGEARFKEGVKLMKEGKFEQARLKFQQSYAVAQRDSVVLNLAIAEQNAKMPVESLTHLRKYLASTKVDAKEKDELRTTMLPQLEQQTSRIQLRGADVLRVKVDSYDVLPTELIDVTPGVHHIDAGDQHREVSLAAGESKLVDFTPAPPQPAATATAPSIPAASGSSAGPQVEVPRPPTSAEDRDVVWTVPRIAITSALVVVGGVGLGLGIAGSSSASSADDRIRNDKTGVASCAGVTTGGCADLGPAYNAKSSAQTQQNAGVALGIGGLALAAGSVVYWYVRPAQVSVAPSATANSGGLLVFGSF